jgi:hypothetical protein
MTVPRSSDHRRAGVGQTVAALLGVTLCAIATGCSDDEVRARHASPKPAPVHTPTATLHHIPPNGYLASDGDADVDDNGNMRAALTPSVHDTYVPQHAGTEAGQPDRRMIAALIKSYYAAAAAGNGVEACPILHRTARETLAEGHGSSTQARANACATGATSFFRQQHQILLTDRVTTMTIVDIRLTGRLAIALVGFRNAPIGMLRLEREGAQWKLLSLLDTNVGT